MRDTRLPINNYACLFFLLLFYAVNPEGEKLGMLNIYERDNSED
jgi:hypothetical protein